jgi:hypothetical protein
LGQPKGNGDSVLFQTEIFADSLRRLNPSGSVNSCTHNPKVGGSKIHPPRKQILIEKLKGADFQAPFFFAQIVRAQPVSAKTQATYRRNAASALRAAF